jgi:hypothetical protein
METPEYPSLPEQGKNLARFTFDIVKQVIQNNESMFVSPETREARMAICKQCEYYDDRQVRCRHCGCFLEHKVKFAIDSCPLQKWQESDEEWIQNGFNTVVEEINKPPEEPPNHPLFPLEAHLGEQYAWRDHTWEWNGTMWDYVYPEEEIEE